MRAAMHVRAATAGAAGRDVVADVDAAVLEEVARDGTALAVWRRAGPGPRITAWLDALAPERLPAGRAVLDSRDAAAMLSTLCDEAGLPMSPGRRWLVDDMTGLAARFAALTACGQVDVRVERITGDACWKFHCDHVRYRLLTTYRGPGTEWVARADADAALRQQRAYMGPVHRLERFDVGLFKGAADDPQAGVVHRSPPIAGTGLARLLLCLNLPSR
jgi:hypothetical protein